MLRELKKILEDIGLNSREARVYLALLRHSEISLADISRLTLIPRMSCYTILNNLLQKGFVDILIKKKRRYFVPLAPQKIFDRILRRAQEFKETFPKIEEICACSPTSSGPKVRFFEGVTGVRAIFRQVINEKRPFAAITSIDDMQKAMGDYFKDFIQERIQKNLKVRLLTNRTKASLELKGKDGQELRETRFIPKEHQFHTAEYIFGNKVALISLGEEPPVVLLIEDAGITEMQTIYFELLWNQAEMR